MNDADWPAAATAAQRLREKFASALVAARKAGADIAAPEVHPEVADSDEEPLEPDTETDVLANYEAAAIEAFRRDAEFLERLRERGAPWKRVAVRLEEELPDFMTDREKLAYTLVAKAMTAVFGEQGSGWKTERRPKKSGPGLTTWVVLVE
jgi:hypothetical protein